MADRLLLSPSASAWRPELASSPGEDPVCIRLPWGIWIAFYTSDDEARDRGVEWLLCLLGLEGEAGAWGGSCVSSGSEAGVSRG